MAKIPRFSSSSRSACNVIVVGAGLAGAATAHFCAQRGLHVTLIEAVSAGASGATLHSRGIVRVYDPCEALMEWGLKGATFWREWSFRDVTPFRQCGVFYIASQSNFATIEARLLRLRDRSDYSFHILSREETARIAQLPPAVHENAVVLYEPHGGFVNPRLAAQLFVESARQFGATIIEGSQVCSIEENGDAAFVHTDSGVICASTVVVAAGAFTKQLLSNGDTSAKLGTDKRASAQKSGFAKLVETTFARSIPLGCIYDPGARLPQFCLIDENSGGYLRPESDVLVFVGGAQQFDAPDVDALPLLGNEEYMKTGELADRLIGRTGNQPIDMRTGFDSYTPDLLPIVRFVDDRSRVAVTFGFSGRGAKYIPALMSDFAKHIVERVGILP